ncbi:MAG: nitroreductase family deazaflavin-dependent oxidoreductase [Ktedonobacterales bacterium]|nr:nitroreductase family deazaflavin-dependent oxidoreductase [Ktedonobacterales bacterium]
MAHDSPSPMTARIQRVVASRPLSAINARLLHHLDRGVFRLSGGRTSAMALLARLPVVNLTTIGAKSGRPRTTPLLGIPDREHPGRLAVVASNWGQAHLPGWYFNCKAQPHVTCLVKGTTGTYLATEIDGAEYARFWGYAASIYAGYLSYAGRAGRHIPIVLLTPTSDASSSPAATSA